MYYVIGIIWLASLIAEYFILRNNKKIFDIDDLLKAKRDDLIVLGKNMTKEKLDELKSKIDDALKLN